MKLKNKYLFYILAILLMLIYWKCTCQIQSKLNEMFQSFKPKVHAYYNNIDSDSVLVLPEMTTYLSKRNESREAIFFTETSGNRKIKSRFMCAVESAATVYPESDIYLLILIKAPYQLSLSDNIALDFVKKYHPNIQVLACDLDILFKNTIMENFYYILNLSKYKAEHTSEILRYFILWKYGGKYFDLDVILIQNMSNITNFVVEEDIHRNKLSNSILGFPKKSSILYQILISSIKSYDGDKWDSIEPNVITEIFEDLCGVPVYNMTQELCHNVHIIENIKFFPISYFALNWYFDLDTSDLTMKLFDKKINDTIGFHVGNSLVKDRSITIGSKQPYGLLAQKYCPRAYWSSDTYF